jgi:hypothetical protein
MTLKATVFQYSAKWRIALALAGLTFVAIIPSLLSMHLETGWRALSIATIVLCILGVSHVFTFKLVLEKEHIRYRSGFGNWTIYEYDRVESITFAREGRLAIHFAGWCSAGAFRRAGNSLAAEFFAMSRVLFVPRQVGPLDQIISIIIERSGGSLSRT